MKRFIVVVYALTMILNVSAQPTRTRVNNNNRNQQQQQQPQQVDRASIMYPTAVATPDEVTWRRDIYRELDLKLDENAPLYYPEMPKDGEQSLFFILFRLLNVGKIPAYKYMPDGTEHFDRSNRIHFRELLEKYEIFHEIDSARRAINVRDADVPGNEVLSYFVKESAYYDQNTATFHTRIVALCPVIHRVADEFSYESMSVDDDDDEGIPVTKYPMFWVKFEDIEPYISKQMIMVSNINNASKMSIADYLATNKYKGKIYMTNNMQNRTIMDYCQTDSAVNLEQKRLEQEVLDFERHLWNPPVDSAAIARRDSIAAAQQQQSSRRSRRARRNAEQAQQNEVQQNEAQQNDENGQQNDAQNNEGVGSRTDARRDVENNSQPANQPRRARVTARRQRH